MYTVDQQIEYSNGCLAKVVWVAEDGHFIIEEDGQYAACWYDKDIVDEEVWCFCNEEDPMRPCVADALMDIDIHCNFE